MGWGIQELAATAVSYFLGEYIENIKSDDISIALWSGILELTNLSFKPNLLSDFGLPVIIKKGTLAKLRAAFPWKHIRSEQTKVEIDGINICAEVSGNILIEKDMESPGGKTTKEMIEEMKPVLPEDAEKKAQTEDDGSGLMSALINNFVVDVTNIHLRLEFNVGNGRVVSAGVIIPKIHVVTIDEDGKEVVVKTAIKLLRKNLILSDLSIYVDTSAQHLDTENFTAEMQSCAESKDHQFVLKDFTFSAIWEHSYEKGNKNPNKFIADIKSIDIGLDRLQWLIFDELSWQQYMFNKKRQFKICGPPQSLPKSQRSGGRWWWFAQKAALKKRDPMEFNLFSALSFLKARKAQHSQLVANIKATKKQQSSVDKYWEKMKENYDLDTVYLLLVYFKGLKELYERKERESIQKTIKLEEADIMDFSFNEENGGTIIMGLVRELCVHLRVTQEQPLLDLSIKNINGSFSMHDLKMNVEATIGQFNICDFIEEGKRKLISFVPNTDNICISGKYKSNSKSRKQVVKAFVSSPQILCDLQKILMIAGFFKSPEHGIYTDPTAPPPKRHDSTKQQIMEVLEKRNFFFIDLDIETPHILVPTSAPIAINFDCVKVHVDPSTNRDINDSETWYDKAILQVRNFSVKMSERRVINPFSATVCMQQLIVEMLTMPNTKYSIDMDAVDVDLTRTQYLDIMNVIDELSAPPLPLPIVDDIERQPQKKAPPKGKVPTNENGMSLTADLSFKRFSLSLYNSNEVLVAKALIGTLTAGMTFVEDKIDCKFTLLEIAANDAEGQPFFKFGKEGIKALECNVIQPPGTSDTSIELSAAEPFFKLDFVWIFQLRDFFILPEKTKKVIEEVKNEDEDIVIVAPSQIAKEKAKEKEKQKIIEQQQKENKKGEKPWTLKGKFLIKNPIIAVNVPGKKAPIYVCLNLGNIDVLMNMSNISKLITANINDMCLAIDERKLLNPFSTSLTLDMSSQMKVDVDLPELRIDFDTSDYFFILDLVDYIKGRFALALTLSETNGKPAENNVEDVKEELVEEKPVDDNFSWLNVAVHNVILDIVEKGTKILHIDLKDLGVKSPAKGMIISINDIYGEEFMTGNGKEWLHGAKLSLKLWKVMEIEFAEKLFIEGKTKPIYWVSSYFTRSPETIIDFTKTPPPPSKPSRSEMRVELKEGFNLPIIEKTGKKLGAINSNNLVFHMVSDPTNGMDMNVFVKQIDISTEEFIKSKHFLQVGIDETLHFRMTKSMYYLKVPHLYIDFQYKYFFTFLGWVTGFASDESAPPSEWKDAPMTLPPMSYEIHTDALILTLIPYSPSIEYPGVHINFEKFDISTKKHPTNIVLSSSEVGFFEFNESDTFEYGKRNDPFMKWTNLNVPVFLDLRNEPPNVKEGFDSSIRDEFVGKSNGFFYGVIVNEENKPIIDSFTFNVSNSSALQLCYGASTFTFSPPPKEPPVHHESAFPGIYTSVNALISSFCLETNDGEKFGSLNISNLNYILGTEGQTVTFDSLLLGKETKVVYLSNSEESIHALKFEMLKTGMFVECSSLDIFADYDFIVRFYNWLMNCPFLSFNWNPYAVKQIKDESANQDQPVQEYTTSIKANNIKVQLLIDKTKEDFIELNTAIEFIMNSSMMKAKIVKLTVAFGRRIGEELYQPIINFQSLVYTQDKYEGKERYQIDSVNFMISISPTDIAAITVLSSTVGELVGKFVKHSAITVDQPEKEVIKSNEGKIFSVNTGIFFIDLCTDNRLQDRPVPLIRIKMDPIVVSFDTSIGSFSKFTTKSISIEHFNNQVHAFDVMLEPTSIEFNFKFSENGSSIKIHALRSMNLNITHGMLNDILAVVSDINKKIANKEISSTENMKFVVDNQLGINANVEVSSEKIELSSGTQFITSSFDGVENVNIRLMNGSVYTVHTKELYYPQFLSNTVIASMKYSACEERLIFSSPVKFINKTPFPLSLFIHGKKDKVTRGIMVDENQEVCFPADQPISSKIGISLIGVEKPKYDKFTVQLLKEQSFVYKVATGNKNHRVKIVISTKFDELTSVLNVTLTPQVSICNHILHTMQIVIGNEKEDDESKYETITIDPRKTEYAKTPVSSLSKLRVKIRIGDNPFTDYFELPPMSKKIPVEALVIENSAKILFCAETKYNQQTKEYVINFYAPAILFNTSGVDLSLTDTEMRRSASFAPIHPDGDPTLDGFAYWGTEQYFQNESQSAILLVEDEWATDSPPLECLNAATEGDFLVTIASSSSIFVPLHYISSSASLSTAITIMPYLMIENKLNYTIQLDPVYDITGNMLNIDNSKKVLVKPGETLALPYSGSKFAYRFTSLDAATGKLYSDAEGVPISFTSPVHTTFMMRTFDCLKEEGVELIIQGSGVNLTATFKHATVSQPLTITNYCNEPIKYYQKPYPNGSFTNDVSSKVTVEGNMSTYVMFEKPFEINDVVVVAFGSEILVNLTDIERTIPFKGSKGEQLFMRVEINDNCTKTIAISQEDIEQPELPLINFKLIVDNFNISLVHDLCEVAVFNIHNITAKFSQNERFKNVSFSINSIQIDDMCPGAPLPVFLGGAPANGYNWLELRCSMFGDAPLFTAFTSILIKMQPITVYADLKFISDLYFCVMPLLGDGTKEVEPIKPASSRSYISDTFITAQHLKIDEVSLNFSIFSDTGRPLMNPILTKLLNFVPCVSNGNINLPTLPINDFTATHSFFKERIINPYIDTLKSQALKLLFNTNMLFNIHEVTSNISRQSSKIADGQVSAIGSATVGTVLAAGEAVLRTGANIFHTVSGSHAAGPIAANMSSAETIGNGLGSFYGNVTNNSINVVHNAIDGAQKDGAFGAVIGLGKGIGTMVMSPLAGILDASTSLLAGAKKFVNDEEVVYRPLRIPRAFTNKVVEEFMQIPSEAQMAIRTMPGNAGELIEVFTKDVADKQIKDRWIAITKTMIFIVREGNSLSPPLFIKDCDASVSKSKILIRFKKADRVLKFTVSSETTARIICAYLNSAKNELNIGETV